MENKEKRILKNTDIQQKKIRALEHWKVVTLFLVLYDSMVGAGSYFMALWLRFDCHYTEIPQGYLTAWLRFMPIYLIVNIVVFWIMHLYQSVWRFASYVELKRITAASMILGFFHICFITLLFQRMPISYYIVGASLQYYIDVRL